MAVDELSVTGGTHTITNVEAVPGPPAPEVYANNVQVGISSIDFTLHFGSMLSLVPPGTVQVARRVSVVMTPEVAKMLQLQLNHGISAFEKQVRKIPDQMTIHPRTNVGEESRAMQILPFDPSQVASFDQGPNGTTLIKFKDGTSRALEPNELTAAVQRFITSKGRERELQK